MKKITRFAVAAALALTMMFTIVACAEPTPTPTPTPTPDPKPEVTTKVGTAYGKISWSKGYVGFITVTTDMQDKATKVVIDEALMPLDFVKVEEGEDFGTEVVTYTTTVAPIKTTTWAKYISIDGKLFTGEFVGTETSPTYKNGTDEAYAYIMDNKKAYVTALLADKVFVAKADGKFLVAATSAGGKTKATSVYWERPAPAMGWKGNIAKLTEHFVKNGFNYTDADIKDPTGSGAAKVPGMIGDVSTGATVQWFTEYAKLAKAAFDARA